MIDDVSQLSRAGVMSLMDQIFQFKREHQGKIHLLKPSGKIIESGELRREFAKEVVRMKRDLGLHVAIIHGAGKQIDAALAAAGMESKRDEKDLRISEAEHIPVINRATLDANDLLCEEIYKAGEGLVSPRGMPGYHPDLNMVGAPIDAANNNFSVASLRSMNPGYLRQEMWRKHSVPVITNMIQLDVPVNGVSIGNGNADTVANAMAIALQAYRLYLCSDVPGVLEKTNPKDETKIKDLTPVEIFRRIEDGRLRVIQEITPQDIPGLLERKVIDKGMRLKVLESFETATKMGPDSAVVILDHNISAETVTRAGWGTAFRAQTPA